MEVDDPVGFHVILVGPNGVLLQNSGAPPAFKSLEAAVQYARVPLVTVAHVEGHMVLSGSSHLAAVPPGVRQWRWDEMEALYALPGGQLLRNAVGTS